MHSISCTQTNQNDIAQILLPAFSQLRMLSDCIVVSQCLIKMSLSFYRLYNKPSTFQSLRDWKCKKKKKLLLLSFPGFGVKVWLDLGLSKIRLFPSFSIFFFFWQVHIVGADRLLAVVPNRDPRKTISLAMVSPDGKLGDRSGSSKRKSGYNKWNAEESLSGNAKIQSDLCFIISLWGCLLNIDNTLFNDLFFWWF